MKRFAAALVSIGVASLAACAPADVSGSYTVAVTDQDNGCNLANWTVGSSAQGIPFAITQSGAAIDGTVGGVTGIGLSLAFGTNVFHGNVAGTHVDMTLSGTRAMNQGACAYTWVGEAQGDLTGNALQGTITYRAQTNNSSDCGTLQTCRSVQAFSGTRPPR